MVETASKNKNSPTHLKKHRDALFGLKSGSLCFERNDPGGFTGYVEKVAAILGKSPPSKGASLAKEYSEVEPGSATNLKIVATNMILEARSASDQKELERSEDVVHKAFIDGLTPM